MHGRLLGVLLAAFAAALPAPAAAQTIELFGPPTCSQLYPSVVTVPPFGEPIDVRVLVLLDGVSQAVAENAMAAAAKPYEPIGLNLKVVEYRKVSFEPVDPELLIQESKKAVGGGRPEGTDVVYTFTSKEMVSSGVLGGSVAGQVDCVSGVAHPEWAFGVGEVGEYGEEHRIAAHEIAHLLGAHHHWANCAEGLTPEVTLYQCTTMINDLALVGMKFSSLNASIIRGHAETYLPGKPLLKSPPPEEEPPPASTDPPPSEPAPAAPGQSQAAPAEPQPAPAAPPHDAEQDRLDGICTKAQSAFAEARRVVAAARRKVRRKATRPRRRALRRATAARDRAERAADRACRAGD